MKTTRNLSLFTFLCLATPLICQGEVDLRTTAKKGSAVWLLQESNQEQTVDMGGQEMETGQKTSRYVLVVVKDVDDKGNLIVETKIERVRGTVTMPMGMGDFEFDSATPAGKEEEDDGMGGMSGMMKKSMMAGAGKTFTTKVSPFGKVVEMVSGADEILKGDEGGMGGSMVDEGTLKQIVEGAFGSLPEKPQAIGGKWSQVEKDGGGRMPVQQKIDMTLAKADADTFEVTATGTVEKPSEAANDDKGDKGDKLEGDDQEAMAREMMKSMKVKNGKMTGTQRVSRKDGFVLESTNTVSMDVEMAAGPMGDMQMSMKMTMVTKRTTAEAAAAPAGKPAGDEKKGDAPKEAGK